ncbi:hypothetical protein GGP93_003270 [Salinibacter ruber]|nr:hypothetical protein [Salinibacter ruber]
MIVRSTEQEEGKRLAVVWGRKGNEYLRPVE